MREVRAMAAETKTAAGAAVASVQGGAIEKMNQAGSELLSIAKQRVEARERSAEAGRSIEREADRVVLAATKLVSTMAQFRESSRSLLESAKKRDLDSNTSIKSLLTDREKMRNCAPAFAK